GMLSLVFWSLILVVSLKYVVFIMRADNRGEGGIMALIALTQRAVHRYPRLRWIFLSMGIFGAALFYGDGIITPAISVLSAIEGLQIAAPRLADFVIPLALAVLVGLFVIQQWGTAGVGIFFGPITILWFIVLGIMGVAQIVQTPHVLVALNPVYGLAFFSHNGMAGFLALGSVVLAVTGAEALYADMGHFGKKAISLAWSGLVLPALLLNYFGQGALILSNPKALENPFYLLAPSWALFPLIVLATAATVIASQAVISGAFSITRQSIQLGYLPRMRVVHTSTQEIGQIYIPFINVALAIGVAVLVLGLRNSSNLAAAYGIAVTGTMATTTLLASLVAYALWKKSIWLVAPATLVFLSVDLVFFAANVPKIPHGGWFPLVIGLAMFTVLSTWKKGRELLLARQTSDDLALEPFLKQLLQYPPTRVPGTAVFLTTSRMTVPHALFHNLLHNKVLHERVIFLTVITEEIPNIPDDERVELRDLGQGAWRVMVRYGFKDEPDIPGALQLCGARGLMFHMMETSFFLNRETILPSKLPGMALWREHLFSWMSRSAESAMEFFKIPPNRVIELGTQVEI
ncbi:MAG TPA: potassium transporter Kup, partial [Thiobacillaceae bacterium]|nr:potassium transporter Kup [Thiobacillaceae bacterium]